jgi:hypothetical protein
VYEHHADDRPGQTVEDDPSASPLLYAGLVGTLVVILIAIAVTALHDNFASRERQRKVYDTQLAQVEELHARQEQALAGYRWIDPNAGVVSIPIDQAMQWVVREGGAAAPLKPAAPQ